MEVITRKYINGRRQDALLEIVLIKNIDCQWHQKASTTRVVAGYGTGRMCTVSGRRGILFQRIYCLPSSKALPLSACQKWRRKGITTYSGKCRVSSFRACMDLVMNLACKSWDCPTLFFMPSGERNQQRRLTHLTPERSQNMSCPPRRNAVIRCTFTD